MKLNVSGHPAHTRSLTIAMTEGDDRERTLHGTIKDIRKCGFVPVAGMLQTSGVVHDMSISGTLDAKTSTLTRFDGRVTTPAFEPSTLTRGESCRDPAPRLAALVGEQLGAGFLTRLHDEFGGELGCSHLLTLAQLMGSGLVTALEVDDALGHATATRRSGERIFHRAVEIDGFELPGRRLLITVQLTDLHAVPAPEIAMPMDRFGAQHEARVQAVVDLPNGMALTEVRAAHRRRTLDEIGSADWLDRSGDLASLEGQNVMAGLGRRLLALLGDRPDDRPFLDALLSLAPGFIQCLASLSEEWVLKAKDSPTLLGVHGRFGTCYMWRVGGPLHDAMEPGNAGEPGHPGKG
jgi:hypothetical protein